MGCRKYHKDTTTWLRYNGASRGYDLLLADVGEQQADRREDWIQSGADKTRPHPMNVMEKYVVDAKEWSESPDGEYVECGEDQRPDDGERQGQDGGNETVSPEFHRNEDDVG